MRRYDLILRAAYGTPWAITPEKGQVIAGILRRIEAGESAPAEALADAIAAKKAKPARRSAAAVALVPIYGTLMQRADLFDQMSGAASTDAIGMQIDELAANPRVETVVFDIDSPGGSVYGVEELGLKIAGLKGAGKRSIAVANSLAASAAYWLASQAQELVVTPNGEVGSIGVYMMHQDVSEAMRTAGVATTFLSAGKRKTAGHPYGPLDDTARAELQAGVDDYYDKFVRAVARGRKTTLSAVRDGFGEGGMVRAEQAVKEGMADRVDTLDGVLKKYGTSVAELVDGSSAESTRPDYEIELRKRKMRL